MIKDNKVLVEEFLVVSDKRLCWQVPLWNILSSTAFKGEEQLPAII